MMNNLNYWEAMRTPPQSALKKIKGGRLSGMSDISPVWRNRVMTETFGPCGTGWKYEIVSFWTHNGHGDEVMAFCQINLYYFDKEAAVWSEPIPGIGGSMLTTQERSGLHNSDEAFKMALTDAMSVSMKALGVAADVYMGVYDTKYSDTIPEVIPKKDISPALAKIAAVDNLDDLKAIWPGIVKEYGAVEAIIDAKDRRKEELS